MSSHSNPEKTSLPTSASLPEETAAEEREVIDWDRLLEEQAALQTRWLESPPDQAEREQLSGSVQTDPDATADSSASSSTEPPTTPLGVLHRYWGYPAFRLKQAEIIESVLAGRDTLGLLPTGGGKSITFQVPTMLLDGLTLVVTPLIALMKDQVDGLNKRGMLATAIHSGMEYKEIQRALDNCLYGDYKFLYLSPERLASPLFQACLPSLPVSLIVVDECHCISQWGYDFRPSYLKIAEIRRYYPAVPLLALTATATPEVVEDVMARLSFREPHVISSSFARDNLQYIVRPTTDKATELLHILTSTEGSAIVYCRNRKKTQELAKMIQEAGVSAHYYHAGLTHAEREIKQNAWMAGDVRVMVCTNAFGMGIDKPDVRLVVHWSMPVALEEYFQEAGRAGRDGQRSFAVTLYERRDRGMLLQRVQNEFPSKEYIREVYDTLYSYLRVGLGEGLGRSYEIDLEAFVRSQHLHPIQSLSALHILELAGAWELLLDEARSRLIVEVSREELYYIRGLSDQDDKVLRAVLRNYSGLFADYVFIDERTLSIQTHLSGQEVYDTLVGLSKRGIIHYVPRKRLPRIIFYTRRERKHHFLIPPEVYELRKETMSRRLAATLAYLDGQQGCRQAILLNYFGEHQAEPCGRCDLCLARKASSQPHRSNLETSLKTLLEQSEEPSITLSDLAKKLSVQEKALLPILQKLIEEDDRYRTDGVHLYKNK